MSTYRLSIFTERALDEIAETISIDNPPAALRVIDALKATFQFLADCPAVGHARDDLCPTLRVFPARRPAHRYVVLFRSVRNGVDIAAVYHGARDWETAFRNLLEESDE
jgi:plasmid stabilization system protein ParE